MRILAIGDLHGKEIWAQAIENIHADIIVFIGDYVLLKRLAFNKKIRMNLEAIIDFKQNNNNVHLLLGNHDTPHLGEPSVIRRIYSPKLSKLYLDNEDSFSAAFQYKDFLFTHAGVTNAWYEQHRTFINLQPGETLADKLNHIQRSKYSPILHECGKARGGTFEHGGITWADKIETENDPLIGYTQIVGHTKVAKPQIIDKGYGRMVYIDCINTVPEFLLIDEEKLYGVTVNDACYQLDATRQYAEA